MKRFGYSLLVVCSFLAMGAASAEAQFGRAGFGSAVAVT